jgi:hypothetical protein
VKPCAAIHSTGTQGLVMMISKRRYAPRFATMSP